MNASLPLLAWSALLLPSAAWSAVSPSDFYCGEVPSSDPLYSKASFKDCGGKEPQGLCIENVSCLYLSDDLKALVQKELKADRFEKISQEALRSYFATDLNKFNKERDSLLEQAKAAAMQNDPASYGRVMGEVNRMRPRFEWMVATLTCAADGMTCPTPQACKGDAFFSMQPVLFDAARGADLIDRRMKNKQGVFQGGPSAREAQ